VELDVFGSVKNLQGDRCDCPFGYPGQYEDGEVGLYYNRFRYYDPDGGVYVSQDPIGLLSPNPNIYSYVNNPTILIDSMGLAGYIFRGDDGYIKGQPIGIPKQGYFCRRFVETCNGKRRWTTYFFFN
jgi:RHS repeat-associated protein